MMYNHPVNDRELAPLDGLDLNLLVTLRALLREASVTRAAARLGQTQPTVSRALAALRSTFSDELLLRAGRGMVLTPKAEAMRASLEQGLSSLEALRSVGRFEPSTASRAFRILIPDLIGAGVLPALAERMSGAPSTSLFVLGNEEEATQALVEGRMDLFLGGLDLIDHPELRIEPVEGAEMDWRVVYGRKHPAWDVGLSLENWLDGAHVQVIPGSRPKAAGILDRWLEQHGFQRKVPFQVGYLSAIGPLLEVTSACATLPLLPARTVAAGRDLRVGLHPRHAELPKVELRMAWALRCEDDEGLEWLRTQLAAALREVLAQGALD